ncbi:uncharacterized protein EI97DRAFT_254418 [Westerdykella ornata]|uniref:Uncharacterized protein n=1 Tax=Westerdykella ornata TaxID=318751 RepID=A0A6A6JPI0_WESOR|nr:uncharacterized protein EI97DRAFT_254418 [Westerdykella ornata]KAF2278432.1 hypothetical protein EI97DRAFT_254418 [Westerdykella ornata]
MAPTAPGGPGGSLRGMQSGQGRIKECRRQRKAGTSERLAWMPQGMRCPRIHSCLQDERWQKGVLGSYCESTSTQDHHREDHSAMSRFVFISVRGRTASVCSPLDGTWLQSPVGLGCFRSHTIWRRPLTQLDGREALPNEFSHGDVAIERNAMTHHPSFHEPEYVRGGQSQIGCHIGSRLPLTRTTLRHPISWHAHILVDYVSICAQMGKSRNSYFVPEQCTAA